MVGSCLRLVPAARMQNIREKEGHRVARYLNRTTADTFWKRDTGMALAGRLVDATLRALTTPAGSRADVIEGVAASVRAGGVSMPAGRPDAEQFGPQYGCAVDRCRVLRGRLDSSGGGFVECGQALGADRAEHRVVRA